MQGPAGPAEDSRQRLCLARSRAVEASYPLVVHSYSSRGFPDLPQRYAALRERTPVHLVSLYDLYHHLDGMAIGPRPGERRFLDSGTYEVDSVMNVSSLDGPPQRLPWSSDQYIEAARRHAHKGDVLVSYDFHTLPLADQVSEGMRLFAAVGVGGVAHDLLVHPLGADPTTVADEVARGAHGIEFLGVTEKDIGQPWFRAAAFLQQLRAALDARMDCYLPIHIFGCLDPRTIPYLFFAGADVFDGLAWMRYYFRDGHAYYDKEMEYDLAPQTLLDGEASTRALLLHNSDELERLRADLQYSVYTGDGELFTECLDTLIELEGGMARHGELLQNER